MATWERFDYIGKGSRDDISKRYLRHCRIRDDLSYARELTGVITRFDLKNETFSNPFLIFESLWIALVVIFVRCFTHSTRGSISRQKVPGFGEFEEEYHILMKWRDKQIAHPSNLFETQNIFFSINDESGKIGGPNYGADRPLSPPDLPLSAIVHMIGLAEDHTESQITADKDMLVKRMEHPDFKNLLRK